MAGPARLTAIVTGHVQGVGFRDWVRRRARGLGLTGSATNLPNGTVQVVAQGPRHDCEELLTNLRSDRTPGRVDSVDTTWDEAADAEGGFRVG